LEAALRCARISIFIFILVLQLQLWSSDSLSLQLLTVWWRHGASHQLSQLSSTLPLHQQLSPSSLALLHVPVPPDTATQSQSLTLESTLGAPGGNTAAHLSLAAAQILKVRESEPESWASAERVMLASAFLATLLLGRWAPMSESEIIATGLWDHSKLWWDEATLELLSGSKEESTRLRLMLGDVERSGGKILGTVAPYFVERYGVNRGMFLLFFLLSITLKSLQRHLLCRSHPNICPLIYPYAHPHRKSSFPSAQLTSL